MCFGHKNKLDDSEDDDSKSDIFECLEVCEKSIETDPTDCFNNRNTVHSTSSNDNTSKLTLLTPKLCSIQSEKCIPYILGNQPDKMIVYEPRCLRSSDSKMDEPNLVSYSPHMYYKKLLSKIPDLMEKSDKKKIEIDAVSLDTISETEDKVKSNQMTFKERRDRVGDKLNKKIFKSNITYNSTKKISKSTADKNTTHTSKEPQIVVSKIDTQTETHKKKSKLSNSDRQRKSRSSSIKDKSENKSAHSSMVFRDSFFRKKPADSQSSIKRLLGSLIRDKNKNSNNRCRGVDLLPTNMALYIDTDSNDTDDSNSDIKKEFFKLRNLPIYAKNRCCGCQSSIWSNNRYDLTKKR